jgi:SAM-dependent methyltransferase
MTDAAEDKHEALIREIEREAPDMITAIAPGTRKSTSSPERYFATAQWSLQPIRLALLAARKGSVRNALDLPCGEGRVMRALKAEFPQARLTACDINRDYVDFCAETFGALPVYSREDPSEIEIEGPFDLIWCGSFFSHVDKPAWTAFLRLFEALLEPGGVLVFTTNGRFAVEDRLRPRRANLGLKDEQIEEFLARYDREGFAYSDWLVPGEFLDSRSLPKSYGVAVAAPAWVCARLEEDTPKLDLLGYTAGGRGRRWGADRPANGLNGQDFVSCIRIRDEEGDSPRKGPRASG